MKFTNSNCKWLAVVLFLAAVLPAAGDESGPVTVWTQHNDNNRTGADLQETQLTVSSVNRQSFGKLFSIPVDDYVYAQPLYVPGVAVTQKINGAPTGPVSVLNLLYVATVNNTVYAFNADDGTCVWKKSLILSGESTENSSNFECNVYFLSLPVGVSDPSNLEDFGTFQKNIGGSGKIGILGTPVIDAKNGVLYVVARTSRLVCCNPDNVHFQRLHALDIATGDEKSGSPRLIDPPDADFDPALENQRPALALSNGLVYVTWAGQCDTAKYHGWVMAFSAWNPKDTSLQREASFNTTRGSNTPGDGGGIWQAGQGPAIDDSGNLYIMTGNGPLNFKKQQYGDSVIRLTPKLEEADFFSPANQEQLEKLDYDLGAAGPLLIPGLNLLLGGGKESKFYLLDTQKLGGYTESEKEDSKLEKDPYAQFPNPNAVQEFFVNSDVVKNQYPVPNDNGDRVDLTKHIHGSPVYWKSPQGPMVYVWTENDCLKAFQMKDGRFPVRTRSVTVSLTAPSTIVVPEILRYPGLDLPIAVLPQQVSLYTQLKTPRSTAVTEVQPLAISSPDTSTFGMPGGFLSLSANGNKDGILWASLPYGQSNYASQGKPRPLSADLHVVPGILRAFDASNFTRMKDGSYQLHEIWNSNMVPGNDVGNFAKFCPPTVANGRVYLATFSNYVDVYGIK